MSDDVTRYDFQHDHIGDCYCGMAMAPDGDYVRHDDHARIVAAQDAEIAALTQRAEKAEAEIVDWDLVLSQQTDLLNRIADILRGPAAPLAAHSFHDLADRVAAVIAERDAARKDAERLDWLETRHSFSAKLYDENDGFNGPTWRMSSVPLVLFGGVEGETVRSIIDAARAAEGGTPDV